MNGGGTAVLGCVTYQCLWVTHVGTAQPHTWSWLPRRGSAAGPCGDQARAHCCRCSMNTEDGAKLYDVCPHVSDSVHWAGVGGPYSLSLWAVQEKGLLSKELVVGPG